MRAFNFPGLARVCKIYCIFVYSVIDPSGTFILGFVPAAELLLLVLCGSLTGDVLQAKLFWRSVPQCIFSSFFSRPCSGHFTGC